MTDTIVGAVDAAVQADAASVAQTAGADASLLKTRAAGVLDTIKADVIRIEAPFRTGASDVKTMLANRASDAFIALVVVSAIVLGHYL